MPMFRSPLRPTWHRLALAALTWLAILGPALPIHAMTPSAPGGPKKSTPPFGRSKERSPDQDRALAATKAELAELARKGGRDLRRAFDLAAGVDEQSEVVDCLVECIKDLERGANVDRDDLETLLKWKAFAQVILEMRLMALEEATASAPRLGDDSEERKAP